MTRLINRRLLIGRGGKYSVIRVNLGPWVRILASIILQQGNMENSGNASCIENYVENQLGRHQKVFATYCSWDSNSSRPNRD